jgi:hypothetical protein
MSTMENADGKGNTNQINEKTSNVGLNSIQIDGLYENKLEITETGKNYEDLQSNDQFLKRKREAEVNSHVLHSEFKETKVHNPEGKYFII